MPTEALSKLEIVDVAAAALINERGEILIAQRPAGKHMAGYWEFPGGKFEAGEQAIDALKREIDEEIGVVVSACRPLIVLEHSYPEKTVRLHVSVVSGWSGEVRSAEGQALKWVVAKELPNENLLPADKPIADALILSPVIAITPDHNAVADWDNALATQTEALQASLSCLSKQRLIAQELKPINILRTSAPVPFAALSSGNALRLTYSDCKSDTNPLHLKSSELKVPQQRREGQWFSASVHNLEELLLAEEQGCDFVLLGSVKATPSHPNDEPMGWDQFAAIVAKASIPVYALGGCGLDDLATAWDAGAQGIAGISAFIAE